MFAPLLAKAQRRATANPVSEMMRQSSTLAARSLGNDLGSEVTPMERAARGASRNVAWDFSKIHVFPANRDHQLIPKQPKLIIGSTTDPLEREADNVANQVMCMPASPVSVSPGHLENSFSLSPTPSTNLGQLQKRHVATSGVVLTLPD